MEKLLLVTLIALFLSVITVGSESWETAHEIGLSERLLTNAPAKLR